MSEQFMIKGNLDSSTVLTIRKYWDVPSTIDRSILDNFYQVQHACRLGIRKHWNVPSTIRVPDSLYQAYQQVRDKKVLRFAKYVLISVPDSLYQFQHFATLMTKTGLTLQAPGSTYKVSILISIHFLKKLVLREFDKISKHFTFRDHFVNSH